MPEGRTSDVRLERDVASGCRAATDGFLRPCFTSVVLLGGSEQWLAFAEAQPVAFARLFPNVIPCGPSTIDEDD